jgi:DNA-binding Xre family transcriptional regulator
MAKSKITLNGKIVNRMKLILAQRGMTIKDLAEAIDHSYPIVVSFCRTNQDTANLVVMAKVCELLGLQPGDIFIYEAKPSAPSPDIEASTWKEGTEANKKIKVKNKMARHERLRSLRKMVENSSNGTN